VSSKSYTENWPARSSNKSKSSSLSTKKRKLENEIKLLNVFVKHKSLQLTAENIHAVTAVIPVSASRNDQRARRRENINNSSRVKREFLAQLAFYGNQRQVTEPAVILT